jgi:hypothetical protein
MQLLWLYILIKILYFRLIYYIQRFGVLGFWEQYVTERKTLRIAEDVEGNLMKGHCWWSSIFGEIIRIRWINISWRILMGILIMLVCIVGPDILWELGHHRRIQKTVSYISYIDISIIIAFILLIIVCIFLMRCSP